jgi:acyl carrier protein
MPSILEIQEFIQQYLPHYMVPELIFVDALPLNSNGKIDRNALLAIRKKDKEKYLAPRSDLEKNICEVWGEILSIPLTQLSLNNDFFKLGGNSILAIKLINKLNKTYGYSLSISAILENTKLEDFCNYLNSSSFYINTENKGQYYEF